MAFSIGAITGTGRTDGVDDLLRQADELMYRVKRGGKDGIPLAATFEDLPNTPTAVSLPRP